MLESADNSGYKIEIELLKSAYYQVIEEPYNNFPNNEDVAAFLVSTATEWASLYEPLARLTEEVLASPLPDELQPILQKAQQVDGFENQIKYVMAFIQGSISYWSEGGATPHSLNETVQTRRGDCKDFSALLIKFLRLLGKDAHVAWVHRGTFPPKIGAIPSYFSNHMIVYVKWQDKTYWLDPTSKIASIWIRQDIANRPALVWEESGIVWHQVPINTPEENEVISILKLIFKPPEMVNVKHTLKYRGIAATNLQEANFGASNAALGSAYKNKITQDLTIIKENYILTPSLDSRISVNELENSLDVDCKGHLDENYEQIAVPREEASLLRALYKLVPSLSYVNGVLIGLPRRTIELLQATGYQFEGAGSFCEVISPWFNWTRHITQTNCSIQFKDDFRSVAYAISNQDLKKDTFIKMQNKLIECSKISLSLQRCSAPAEAKEDL